MSLETSAVKLCISLGKAADSAAPAKIKSAVNSRAIFGGAVLACPLFGLDAILYAIILWGMYSKVANIAGIKFSGKIISNILGGFIINVICVFALNFFADWIMFFGWIGMFFAGYWATKYSGIAYLGILEQFHGRASMKTGLDYEAGKKAFLESDGKKATTGVGKSLIMDQVKDNLM